MSAGLNRVDLLGNLGAAPKLRPAEGRKRAWCDFSVAVNERWKDNDGKPHERTEWFRVVAFGGLAELCAKRLEKGSLVYVAGPGRHDEWVDKDGQTRRGFHVDALDVQFLPGKGSGRAPLVDPHTGEVA